MSEMEDVIKLVVPRSVLTEGYAFMRAAGKAQLEGIVLWVGQRRDKIFEVSKLIIPNQRGLRTPDGLCAVVDSEELRRLNMFLYRNKLELVAQVHSHPTHAYHSDTDDRYAIATTVGCFSMVVPNFAVRDYALAECAVYRLQASGEWLEVDDSMPPNQIEVIES